MEAAACAYLRALVVVGVEGLEEDEEASARDTALTRRVG